MKNIWNRFVLMGFSQEEHDRISDEIVESNRQFALVWSWLLGGFWVMALVMSFKSPAFAACQAVYAVALGVCVLTGLSARFLVSRNARACYVTMRTLSISLLVAGIGIAMCQPDVRSITMFVAVVIVPVMFIEKSSVVLMELIGTVVAYVLLCRNVITPEVYSWGLLNLCIFAVAGLNVGDMVNRTRYERYLYSKEISDLLTQQAWNAQHDQLTGVGNRRAYAERLTMPAPSSKDQSARQCSVIMIDLNGLKNTNDSLGHDAGDELIVATARGIQKAFPDDAGHIYRIGGDEFCIITEMPPDAIRESITTLRRIGAEHEGSRTMGFSVSCGFATTEGNDDLQQIAKLADCRMYEDKKAYYAMEGHDRRKPR